MRRIESFYEALRIGEDDIDFVFDSNNGFVMFFAGMVEIGRNEKLHGKIKLFLKNRKKFEKAILGVIENCDDVNDRKNFQFVASLTTVIGFLDSFKAGNENCGKFIGTESLHLNGRELDRNHVFLTVNYSLKFVDKNFDIIKISGKNKNSFEKQIRNISESYTVHFKIEHLSMDSAFYFDKEQSRKSHSARDRNERNVDQLDIAVFDECIAKIGVLMKQKLPKHKMEIYARFVSQYQNVGKYYELLKRAMASGLRVSRRLCSQVKFSECFHGEPLQIGHGGASNEVPSVLAKRRSKLDKKLRDWADRVGALTKSINSPDCATADEHFYASFFVDRSLLSRSSVLTLNKFQFAVDALLDGKSGSELQRINRTKRQSKMVKKYVEFFEAFVDSPEYDAFVDRRNKHLDISKLSRVLFNPQKINFLPVKPGAEFKTFVSLCSKVLGIRMVKESTLLFCSPDTPWANIESEPVAVSNPQGSWSSPSRPSKSTTTSSTRFSGSSFCPTSRRSA